MKLVKKLSAVFAMAIVFATFFGANVAEAQQWSNYYQGPSCINFMCYVLGIDQAPNYIRFNGYNGPITDVSRSYSGYFSPFNNSYPGFANGGWGWGSQQQSWGWGMPAYQNNFNTTYVYDYYPPANSGIPVCFDQYDCPYYGDQWQGYDYGSGNGFWGSIFGNLGLNLGANFNWGW